MKSERFWDKIARRHFDASQGGAFDPTVEGTVAQLASADAVLDFGGFNLAEVEPLHPTFSVAFIVARRK